MLLIYYFFKQFKTMNQTQNHESLGSIKINQSPENSKLAQKHIDTLDIIGGKKHVDKYAEMPPFMSQQLLLEYIASEGNQVN